MRNIFVMFLALAATIAALTGCMTQRNMGSLEPDGEVVNTVNEDLEGLQFHVAPQINVSEAVGYTLASVYDTNVVYNQKEWTEAFTVPNTGEVHGPGKLFLGVAHGVNYGESFMLAIFFHGSPACSDDVVKVEVPAYAGNYTVVYHGESDLEDDDPNCLIEVVFDDSTPSDETNDDTGNGGDDGGSGDGGSDDGGDDTGDGGSDNSGNGDGLVEVPICTTNAFVTDTLVGAYISYDEHGFEVASEWPREDDGEEWGDVYAALESDTDTVCFDALVDPDGTVKVQTLAIDDGYYYWGVYNDECDGLKSRITSVTVDGFEIPDDDFTILAHENYDGECEGGGDGVIQDLHL